MAKIIRRALHAIKNTFSSLYFIWPDGRDSLVYREGNRRLMVWAEFGMDDTGGEIYLYPATTMRWGPPHEDELIPEEKRREILHRLLENVKKKDRCAVRIIHDGEREVQERQAAERARVEKAAKANFGTKL